MQQHAATRNNMQQHATTCNIIQQHATSSNNTQQHATTCNNTQQHATRCANGRNMKHPTIRFLPFVLAVLVIPSFQNLSSYFCGLLSLVTVTTV